MFSRSSICNWVSILHNPHGIGEIMRVALDYELALRETLCQLGGVILRTANSAVFGDFHMSVLSAAHQIQRTTAG